MLDTSKAVDEAFGITLLIEYDNLGKPPNQESITISPKFWILMPIIKCIYENVDQIKLCESYFHQHQTNFVTLWTVFTT